MDPTPANPTLPARRLRPRPEADDDDGPGLAVQSRPQASALSPAFQWSLVGVMLASGSLVSAAVVLRKQRSEAQTALLAAFAAGALASAASALLLVVGLRGEALRWARGLLSPVDLMPEEAISTERARRERPENASRGTITLVGAGSGTVAQLTLEAFAALQSADVVICDRVLPAQLYAAVPPHAVLHIAEKIPGQADAAQAELYAWGVAALRLGRRVVRLKVGDPFLYGRGGEEVLFYRSQGFEPRVLPGISSALAAPLLAGIPITHRGVANQVLITTGRDRGGALPPLPTFEARRSLVLLMAVGRLPLLHADLAALGYPDDTPVAVIERSTHPDERLTRAPLHRVAAEAARVGVTSPAIIVVGHCLDVLSGGSSGGAGGGGDSGSGGDSGAVAPPAP